MSDIKGKYNEILLKEIYVVKWGMARRSVFDTSLEEKTLNKNMDKYRGYIVLVIEDKVFATKRAKNVHKMIKEIEKKYHRSPLITVVPKGDTLIV